MLAIDLPGSSLGAWIELDFSNPSLRARVGGILARMNYPPPSHEVCVLHPAEPELEGGQAVPQHPAEEALWTDQTWRPCTVLAWARAAGGGWVVFIRWPDGASGWYEHDPGCLRPAG